MNGKLKKNVGQFKGYNCDRIFLDGMELYLIGGSEVPVESKGEFMGARLGEKAVKIQRGNPPSSVFSLPRDVSYDHDMDADEEMADMARRTIQALLNGDMPPAGDEDGELPDLTAMGSHSAGSGSSPGQKPPTEKTPGKVEAGLKKDAEDVGQAARKEAKDATIDGVREGVRSVIKGFFN